MLFRRKRDDVQAFDARKEPLEHVRVIERRARIEEATVERMRQEPRQLNDSFIEADTVVSR